ncbi:MAG: hypothetical protein ABWZ27_12610 [Aestuariivirgaceae bacterium]
MLFYGNRCQERDPRQVFHDLDARLAAALAMPPGLPRHAALVAALIAWGELLQGVADATSEASGIDRQSPAETVLAARLVAIADLVRQSFDSLQWQSRGALPPLRPPLLPERILLRRPEGYLHYALYPETYRVAARRMTGPLAGVIGIRSIGTSLAAMVAASAGIASMASLRPRGDPYRRHVVADHGLVQAMRDRQGAIAVVDEGPGLSGSTFVAVVDWLRQHGVASRRIRLFPSHAGTPGPQAGDAAARRWQGLQRHVATFEDVFLDTDHIAHRLTTWLGDAIGPLSPLEDLSGGAWRRTVFGPEQHWPPVVPAMEMRKYRTIAAGRPLLVKFAGLGPTGERKLAMAQAMSAAGFTAEPLALVHGFLVERWLAAAPAGTLASLPRHRLIARLGDYLGFRAAAFPAASDEGASLRDLVQMAVLNTGEVLGQGFADRLARQLSALPSHEAALARCATDNRLQPFEWLVQPDGQLIKADALDHAFGHDLVGCQDIAWDLAGTAVEFDLDDEERGTLARRVERISGRGIGRQFISSLEPCYLAMELGRTHFGFALPSDTGDRNRLHRSHRRYARKLQDWIQMKESSRMTDNI